MASVNIDTPSLVKRMTLNVTLKRHKQAMLRVHLAKFIIRFAAWVGGFGEAEINE